MTSSLTSFLQSLRILPATTKVESLALPEITLEEVSHHDDFNDCWIVIYDRVYDVTDFLCTHPGGEGVLMDHAGRDATLAFHGTGHSHQAIAQMRDYLIGELPIGQRIFRKQHGNILSSDIPE